MQNIHTQIQARILDGSVVDASGNPIPLSVYKAHNYLRLIISIARKK
jgi:hypothetical protein